MTHGADIDRTQEWADMRDRHLADADVRPASTARGVHHVALLSTDVERTIAFYQGVLEFPLTELFENRDYTGSTHFFFDIGNGNQLAFFDFPGLDLGPYAEVLGGLDTLVNNAFWTKANRIRKLSDDNWRRSIQVTQDAVFFGIRAAFTVMLRQGYGSIINTASICGLGGDDGMSPYNAAKAAVINMTRSAALEAAEHGVRVNCICPGLIETPAVRRAYLRNEALESHIAAQVPMRRLGQPEDIAKAAAFLASEEAAYVTGAALVVDGGQSIHSGVPDLGL